MTRPTLLALALLAACADDARDLDTGTIGVPGTTTPNPEPEDSSSAGDEVDAEPYGLCESDEDCPLFGDTMLAECRDRTCTYACGNGWGDDVCPASSLSPKATCISDKSRCGIEPDSTAKFDCIHECQTGCQDCGNLNCEAMCTNGCVYSCPDPVCPDGMIECDLGCCWGE